MGEYNIIILNLFLVITVLLLSYPTEVQGFRLHYPTGQYRYTWRTADPRKRMDINENTTEEESDGENLLDLTDIDDGYDKEDLKNGSYNNKEIFFINVSKVNPENDDGATVYDPEKSSDTRMRKRNFGPTGYRKVQNVKVLHSQVPGAVIIWPSSL